ncbi:hypothetical protein BDQ12DRAFT_488623 [Crucibulum laeve]|uniref:G-protein coupled receptors family 1 profile domain-containing protein n=1 Tax=Crucibulum laeve TaxID=68775 RepID=A0A5C3M6C5_9AGAR|nr:hypothetical protein BDQ12DRAFT_488623 [Crucibulum laeve]
MSELIFIKFPVTQMAGATAVYVFAVLSAFALLSVVLRIIWLGIQRHWTRAEPQEYVFFHTQLGHYAACLLIANLFNSTAGLVGITWVVNRGITEGSVCRAQALVMQIGNWGQAYFTVTIAVHTFNSLVLRRRQSVLICTTTISIGWIVTILLAAVPFMMHNPDGFVYGANGFSCGVRAIYPKAEFMFHLLPIFVASVFSAVLYSLIFLALRGTLMIKGGLKLTFDPNERWNNDDGVNYHRFVARVARSMLWYPIAYIILLVPYSVMRLLDISGFIVPFEAMVFAYVCWFTLGVINVMLLYNTFRVLGPAFDARSSASSRKDLESFGTTELGPSNSFSPAKRSSLQRKIDEYRFPIPAYRPQSQDSLSAMSGTSSTRNLLSLQHERNGSSQSFQSFATPHMIGRSITPSTDLDRIIAAPEPALQSSSPVLAKIQTENLRQDSSNSLGLPAPPRRTRSPILREPDPAPASTVDGPWEMVSPAIPRQPSNDIFGYPREEKQMHSPSWSSEELDTTGWVSRQQQNVTLDSNGRPLVSAVAPSFTFTESSPPRQLVLVGQNGHTRSMSAMSSVASGPRPLILSRKVSVDRSISYASSSTASRYSRF